MSRSATLDATIYAFKEGIVRAYGTEKVFGVLKGVNRLDRDADNVIRFEDLEIGTTRLEGGAGRLTKAELREMFDFLDTQRKNAVTTIALSNLLESAAAPQPAPAADSALERLRAKVKAQFSSIGECYRWACTSPQNGLRREDLRRITDYTAVAMSPTEFAALFEKMTPNANGYISSERFQAVLEGNQPASSGSKVLLKFLRERIEEKWVVVEEGFRWLSDGGNQIGRDEWEKNLKLHLRMTTSDAFQMWSMLGKTDTGTLSQREYLVALAPEGEVPLADRVLTRLEGLGGAFNVLSKGPIGLTEKISLSVFIDIMGRASVSMSETQRLFALVDLDRDNLITLNDFISCLGARDAGQSFIEDVLSVIKRGWGSIESAFYSMEPPVNRDKVQKMLRPYTTKADEDGAILFYICNGQSDKALSRENFIQSFKPGKVTQDVLARAQQMWARETAPVPTSAAASAPKPGSPARSAAPSAVAAPSPSTQGYGPASLAPPPGVAPAGLVHQTPQLASSNIPPTGSRGGTQASPRRKSLMDSDVYAQWERGLSDKVRSLLTRLRDKCFERYKSLEEAFEWFDTDGDDTISELELARAVMRWGMTEHEAALVFQAIDLNGSKAICKDEFFKTLSKVSTAAPGSGAASTSLTYCATSPVVTQPHLDPRNSSIHRASMLDAASFPNWKRQMPATVLGLLRDLRDSILSRYSTLGDALTWQDPVVGFLEFYAPIRRLGTMSDDDIRALFDALDLDKKKMVAKSDVFFALTNAPEKSLEVLLNQCEQHLHTYGSAQDAFDAMDRNKDRHISLEE